MSRVYDLMTGSRGLHVAHHERPGLHGSLLPAVHEEIEQGIPDERIARTLW